MAGTPAVRGLVRQACSQRGLTDDDATGLLALIGAADAWLTTKGVPAPIAAHHAAAVGPVSAPASPSAPSGPVDPADWAPPVPPDSAEKESKGAGRPAATAMPPEEKGAAGAPTSGSGGARGPPHAPGQAKKQGGDPSADAEPRVTEEEEKKTKPPVASVPSTGAAAGPLPVRARARNPSLGADVSGGDSAGFSFGDGPGPAGAAASAPTLPAAAAASGPGPRGAADDKAGTGTISFGDMPDMDADATFDSVLGWVTKPCGSLEGAFNRMNILDGMSEEVKCEAFARLARVIVQTACKWVIEVTPTVNLRRNARICAVYIVSQVMVAAEVMPERAELARDAAFGELEVIADEEKLGDVFDAFQFAVAYLVDLVQDKRVADLKDFPRLEQPVIEARNIKLEDIAMAISQTISLPLFVETKDGIVARIAHIRAAADLTIPSWETVEYAHRQELAAAERARENAAAGL